jgi:hypothetical protein
MQVTRCVTIQSCALSWCGYPALQPGILMRFCNLSYWDGSKHIQVLIWIHQTVIHASDVVMTWGSSLEFIQHQVPGNCSVYQDILFVYYFHFYRIQVVGAVMRVLITYILYWIFRMTEQVVSNILDGIFCLISTHNQI